MDLVTTLFLKLLPLYAVIGLGFAVARWAVVDGASVATLLIYAISPVVFFGSTATAPLTPGLLALPVLVFVLCAVTGIAAWQVGRRLFPDNTANLFGFAAGNANTGYFGVPVFLALYGETDLGLYMVAILGFQVYENTVGYYLIARGRFSVRDSLIRLARLPPLYAVLLGITLALLHWPLPAAIRELVIPFRGAYIVLGMMLIGLVLSSLRRFVPDMRFVGGLFALRFLVGPLVTLGLIAVDRSWLHLGTATTERILLVISVLPLAANTVAFAARLEVQPEKAATTVFLSTLFALGFIPLARLLFLP